MSSIVNDAINQAKQLFFAPEGTPPVVQLPRDTICDPIFSNYVTGENFVPMAFVSVTNVALQYIFNLRDFILSCDDTSITRETKFALVSVLSVTTAFGYTYLTLQEASLRALVFSIIYLVALPFMLIGLFTSFATENRIMSDNVNSAMLVSLSAFSTSTLCVAQIGTGFFAAHHMMTSANANLPEVSTVVSEATFGLSNFVAKTAKDFYMDINRYRYKPSRF